MEAKYAVVSSTSLPVLERLGFLRRHHIVMIFVPGLVSRPLTGVLAGVFVVAIATFPATL
jgi:hypothetical protein